MAGDTMSAADYDVIDFGAHLLPTMDSNIMHDMIEETAGGKIWGDPDVAREVYDDAGVEGVVFSQPPFMGHDDADVTADENDTLLEIIEDYDGFYGLAAIPTAAGGEAAAAELDRSLENGYNGGALETMSDGIELTDDAVEPIFSAAEDAGAPLLVHPKLNESLHPEVLDDRWVLNATWGREVALCESIFKCIHTGVLDRHPDLDLVFHHTGGNIASMMGRIELQLRRGFWPGLDDTKPFPEFKRQLEERVYIDTSGYADHHAPFRMALEELPAGNLLFATDFPFENRTADQLSSLVETIDDVAPQTEADGILAGNALDLMVNL